MSFDKHHRKPIWWKHKSSSGSSNKKTFPPLPPCCTVVSFLREYTHQPVKTIQVSTAACYQYLLQLFDSSRSYLVKLLSGGTFMWQMVLYISVGVTICKICQPLTTIEMNGSIHYCHLSWLPHGPASHKCTCTKNIFFNKLSKVILAVTETYDFIGVTLQNHWKMYAPCA